MYTVNFLAFLNCEIHLQIDKIWGFFLFCGGGTYSGGVVTNIAI